MSDRGGGGCAARSARPGSRFPCGTAGPAQALSRAAAAGDTPALGLRAAAAKVYCSEALMRTAGEMIQLHGAIGITWEHRAHRYLKGAHGAMNLFGSPTQHAAIIAASFIDR